MHEPSTLPVMVIDDEPHLRITASQTLELAGYTPHCFESAEQALAALPNDFPGVIVSDIRMPGMDGMALLHELHSRDATLPIILITGHGDISTAVEAMRAGAWDFLEKPFAGDQLLDVVRRGIEKRQLSLENLRLKAELEVQQAALGPRLVGRTPVISRLAAMIQRISQVEADVLLFGETGTGKELWARMLHRLSSRAKQPFVPVNCAALTATLAESQLFGHEKGAFTGALGRSLGVFRAAEGGVVFLDEVGEMPLEYASDVVFRLDCAEAHFTLERPKQRTRVRAVEVRQGDHHEPAPRPNVQGVFLQPKPAAGRRRDDQLLVAVRQIVPAKVEAVQMQHPPANGRERAV